MDAFWPGPLTLILKRAPHIADTVSGRQDSIGLRCPSHPVAQALLAASPPASRTGRAGWRRRRPISSGRSRRRWPSTCARNSPTRSRPACRCWKAGVRSGHRIHHPGPVAAGPGRRSRAAASRPCQRRADRGGAGRAGVRARRGRAARLGTLKAHYAPRTELELAGDARVADVLQGIGLPSGQVALVSFDPAPASTDARVQWRQVPSDPARYAQALYALARAGRPGLCPHRRAGAARQRRMACGQRPHRPRRRRLHARYLRPVVFGQSRLAGMRPERRCASHGRLAAFPGLASGLAEPTGISSHLLDRASLLSRGDEGGNFNQGK